MLQDTFQELAQDEVGMTFDQSLFDDELPSADETAQAVTPEIDLIEMIMSRIFPGFAGDNDPNAQAELPREIMDSVAAIKNTEKFRPETVKLETSQMTTSGELGAQAAENYISGKADAIHNAKAGLHELKSLQADMAAAGKTTAAQDAAAQGPSALGIAGGAVAGGIVAAAVGAVSQTAGRLLGGAGSLKTFNQVASSFRSPIDSDAGYGNSSGHATTDLGDTNRPVVDVMDWDRQELLGDVQLVEDFMLDQLGLPLTPEALETIEAQLMEMEVDMSAGRNAFEAWKDAPKALAEISGEIDPALVVTPEQMAALTMEEPEDVPSFAAPRMQSMGMA